MKNEKRIIDLAYDYRFNSPENFNRAFKKLFYKTPTQIRKIKGFNIYQRMNLSDKNYFGKVYEKMPFFRVKKFFGYGKTPEENAWLKTKEFIIKNKILNYQGIRLFGFNDPETNPFKNKEYGYIFLLYVPELENCVNFINYEINESLYLNFCVPFKSIYNSWKYFNYWKNYNNYNYGDSQWMEEHFLDKRNLSFKKYIKLYLPIK